MGEIVHLRWDRNVELISDKSTGQTAEDRVRIDKRPATTNEPPFSVKDKEARKIDVPRPLVLESLARPEGL